MKKTKTSLAIAVALATGVGTSAYAQLLTKQDTITLALTLQSQESVSTSATLINAGNFSQGPLYYKTQTTKFTQANLLKAIAIVLHGNPGFYSTSATLELVQGELGGFWNITDPLAQSYPEFSVLDYNGTDTDFWLSGSYNDDGDIDYNPYYEALDGPFFPSNAENGGAGPTPMFNPDPYGADPSDLPVPTGTFTYLTPGNWFDSFIQNSVDTIGDGGDPNGRTSIADGVNEYAQLDTGRHFLPVPWQSYNTNSSTGVAYATTGEYPVGHMQPWGQVYVKDPGHKDTSGDPLCENVTFFFDFEVTECYDCFYLSSFISDAQFKITAGTQVGPPCCGSESELTGKGTDHYYLTMEFDNTINNSYLNDAVEEDENDFYYGFVGFKGLEPIGGGADGLTPDLLTYSDVIKSRLGTPSQYETRFSLHGIVTYNWTLKFINPGTDAAADYIGSASYAANGYGFISLFCTLITGSATFTETAVKDIGCCDDEAWYEQEYNYPDTNGQGDYGTTVDGWYGPGWSGWHGYFDPNYDQYNPYPYLNRVGGYSFNGNDQFDFSLPQQHESPFNPAAALTRHLRDDGSSSVYNDDNADVNNYEFDN